MEAVPGPEDLDASVVAFGGSERVTVSAWGLSEADHGTPGAFVYLQLIGTDAGGVVLEAERIPELVDALERVARVSLNNLNS